MGSGIKCGINVWQAKHTFRTVHDSWAHRLPENSREAVKAGMHSNGHLTTRRIIMRLLCIVIMVAVAAYVYQCGM